MPCVCNSRAQASSVSLFRIAMQRPGCRPRAAIRDCSDPLRAPRVGPFVAAHAATRAGRIPKQASPLLSGSRTCGSRRYLRFNSRHDTRCLDAALPASLTPKLKTWAFIFVTRTRTSPLAAEPAPAWPRLQCRRYVEHGVDHRSARGYTKPDARRTIGHSTVCTGWPVGAGCLTLVLLSRRGIVVETTRLSSTNLRTSVAIGSRFRSGSS